MPKTCSEVDYAIQQSGQPDNQTSINQYLKRVLVSHRVLCISQCWLDNGYEIRTLHLEGKRRVVFRLAAKSKNTASVEIPEVLKYGRIPNEAKYELENYFKYIMKKYGL